MEEQVELISAGFIEETDIERLLRRARTHRRVHQEGEPIARGDRPDTGNEHLLALASARSRSVEDRASSCRNPFPRLAFGIGLKAKQEIGGLGGKTGGTEDRAVVLAQHLQP